MPKPGRDILQVDAKGDTYGIKFKTRIDGATDFFITHDKVMASKKAVPPNRLAPVRINPRGAKHDELRYLDDHFAATGIRGDWAKQLAKRKLLF